MIDDEKKTKTTTTKKQPKSANLTYGAIEMCFD